MYGGSADFNSREHGGPEGMDPNGVSRATGMRLLITLMI